MAAGVSNRKLKITAKFPNFSWIRHSPTEIRRLPDQKYSRLHDARKWERENIIGHFLWQFLADLIDFAISRRSERLFDRTFAKPADRPDTNREDQQSRVLAECSRTCLYSHGPQLIPSRGRRGPRSARSALPPPPPPRVWQSGRRTIVRTRGEMHLRAAATTSQGSLNNRGSRRGMRDGARSRKQVSRTFPRCMAIPHRLRARGPCVRARARLDATRMPKDGDAAAAYARAHTHTHTHTHTRAVRCV